VIRVLRPYANEEEYLASERFSIDSKSMLLIDQRPLPVGTPIVFEIQLQNGQKPIRAEARVIGHVAPTSDAPGGLRVRFKRFGVATKSFIDRAIGTTATSPSVVGKSVPINPASRRPASRRPASRRPASISSSSIDAGWSCRPASMSLVPPPVADDPGSTHTAPELAEEPMKAAERGESSGIHRRPVVPVAAPANREELLERLRGRARNMSRKSERRPGEIG